MFAKSLLLAATAAQLARASQEFGIINEASLSNTVSRLLQDDAESAIVEEEPVVKLTCKDRAQVPGDRCYFKSHVYMAKSKEEKMAELWTEILVDEEPMEYYWSEFPNVFT